MIVGSLTVELPTGVMDGLYAGWVSHTGEVVLCWGSVEKARHEDTSDEYKTVILLMYPDPHHGGRSYEKSVVHIEQRIKGTQRRGRQAEEH